MSNMCPAIRYPACVRDVTELRQQRCMLGGYAQGSASDGGRICAGVCKRCCEDVRRGRQAMRRRVWCLHMTHWNKTEDKDYLSANSLSDLPDYQSRVVSNSRTSSSL